MDLWILAIVPTYENAPAKGYLWKLKMKKKWKERMENLVAKERYKEQKIKVTSRFIYIWKKFFGELSYELHVPIRKINKWINDYKYLFGHTVWLYTV